MPETLSSPASPPPDAPAQRGGSSRKGGPTRILRVLLGTLPPALLATLVATTLFSYHFASEHLRPGQPLGGGTVAFVLGKNLALYLLVYGGLYQAFYRASPGRTLARWRLDERAPERRQVRTEARRTLVSALVSSGYELGLAAAASRGWLPLSVGPMASWSFALGFPLLLLWADAHFYATHRLLHTRWLYRHVHRVHHQSYNPHPWSGLSFHPVESAVYFSALLIALLVPMHLAHLVALKVLLDVTPAFGHLGFGGWTGGSRFHYLHHTLTHYNFGGTPLFDVLSGTYVARRPSTPARVTARQAKG